jgi:hypothetical protein
MHLFIFFCFQALTWGCTWEFYLPSPCLKSINLCWFQKYFGDMEKYSMTCHQIFCHVTWNLPRGKQIFQEYSMTWHRIFLKILSCSNEQAHLLTHWCRCTMKKKLIILQHSLHLIISFDTIRCHSWNCLNQFSYQILIGIVSRIVQGWPYEKLQF